MAVFAGACDGIRDVRRIVQAEVPRGWVREVGIYRQWFDFEDIQCCGVHGTGF